MKLKVEGMNWNGFVHTEIKGNVKSKKETSAYKYADKYSKVAPRVTTQQLNYLADSYRITHKHVNNPELIGLASLKLMRAQSNM